MKILDFASLKGTPAEVENIVFDLYAEGLLEPLFPGFIGLNGCKQSPNNHSEGDALAHTLKVVAFAAQDNTLSPSDRIILLTAAFVHDIEKPSTREVHADGGISFYGHAAAAAARCLDFADNLGFTAEQAIVLEWVVRHHMDAFVLLGMPTHKRLEFYDSPYFPILCVLQSADALASLNPEGGHAEVFAEKFAADAAQLRETRANKLALAAMQNRITPMLASRGIAPGPCYSQAGRAANAELSPTVSQEDLSAWLDNWLVAHK